MITLSYGFKQPETGDRGTVFWPALEDVIEQTNNHNHDGSNSAKLTSSSVTTVSQSISSASWAAQGGGTFKQTVTMPGTMLYNDYAIVMKLTSDLSHVYPTIIRTGANTYDVYVNDSSIDLKAFYV